MEIHKNTYGRLYTKNWVEFDLVASEPAIFRFDEDRVEVRPGEAMFVNANQLYSVSKPITRCQIPLSYFDGNHYFDSEVLQGLNKSYSILSPDDPQTRAVILGVQTAMDLTEEDNDSRYYLEPGLLYSTLETFQLFLRDSAAKPTVVKRTV